MTANTIIEPAVGTDPVDKLMADFTDELARVAELYPIAIPLTLTDSGVMAGDYAPLVIKRRIHRRARAIQVAITRAKIRCDRAEVN